MTLKHFSYGLEGVFIRLASTVRTVAGEPARSGRWTARKGAIVVVAFLGVGLLSACATAPVDEGLIINSASGRPEAYFPTPPELTMGKIASGCMDHKGVVTDSSTNEVVCEMPMSFGSQFASQLLLGNAYSTTPQEFLRFNIVPTGQGGSRVQGSGWIETTMAFGQKHKVDLSGGRFGRQMQELLVNLGGSQAPI